MLYYFFNFEVPMEVKRGAAEASRVIAEASRTLAKSLDYTVTLENIARVAVGELADWCMVDLLEVGESPSRTLLVTHRDSSKPELARIWQKKWPQRWDDRRGIPNVMRTGKSEIYPRITDRILEFLAQDQEHLEVIKNLAMKSVMIVPLTARGRVFGTLTFVTSSMNRKYGRGDLEIAEELGIRGGLAIDNALSYQEVKQAKELAEEGRAQIAKLLEITSSLSRAVTQTEIADVLMRFLMDLFPSREIALALKSFNGRKIELTKISSLREIKSYPQSEITTGDPILRAMARQKKVFSRRHFVVPLLFQQRCLGALDFTEPSSCFYNASERLFLDSIMQHASQALERARLFESELSLRLNAENAQHRFKFLSEASMILSENLNHEKTLKKIVAHAVPRFADGCLVDLLQDGKLHRIAAAHSDPRKQLILHEIAWEANLHVRAPMNKILRSGKSYLTNDVQEIYDLVEAEGRSSANFKKLGMKSIIFVPLGPKEKPIGTMGFWTSEANRYFSEIDVNLAEELSRRATVAIENARLFSQVQDSVKVRDEFLSIASHELKTPLTSIRLQIELVKRSNDLNSAENERLAKAFEIFDLQTERLSKLIDSLLDLTLIQAGRFSLNLELINLSDLIENAVARLPTSIPRPILELDPGVRGFWDRTRLDQVVVNLISNGIKYGGDKPLHIKIYSQPSKAILVVQDFGMGIAKSDQDIIFDRFQRAQGESKAWGMGLGLFITRQIVEAHHGLIKVESELHKGSTFIVEIPMPALMGKVTKREVLRSLPMVLH